MTMLTAEQWMGVVRHLVTAVGGYLTGAGFIDDATAQTAIGAFVTLVGVIFSVRAKTA